MTADVQHGQVRRGRNRPRQSLVQLSHWGLSGVLLAVAGPMLGCSGEPSVNSLRAMVVVQDKAVMRSIQGFSVGVFHTSDNQGRAISCDDFPSEYGSVYRNTRLRVEATQWVRWNGERNSANTVLEVTSGDRYVVVVEGQAQLGPDSGYVVARGCRQAQVASEASPEPVEIDVRATTGSGCKSDEDCERSVDPYSPPRCLNAAGFPEAGYCAVPGCADNADCPPATACVTVGNVAVCAAVCISDQDCETGNFVECLASSGPSGACARVCLKASAPYQRCTT